MFELFFIVMLWVVIFSIAKKSTKSGVKKKNSGARKNSDYEVQRNYANNAGKSSASQSKKAVAGASSGRPAGSTAKPDKNTSSPQSTTEMLRQKALQDEREHRLEKQKQKMENKRHYGNLNYAGRYLPGDPVPQSRKLIICDYCNAENLVPKNDNPGKYNCYFCREKL